MLKDAVEFIAVRAVAREMHVTPSVLPLLSLPSVLLSPCPPHIRTYTSDSCVYPLYMLA